MSGLHPVMMATAACVTLAGFLGTVLLLLRQHDQASRVNLRLLIIRDAPQARSKDSSSSSSMTAVIASFGTFLARSGILPARTLRELEATLATASLGGTNGLALFIGSKFLLAVALFGVSLVLLRNFSLPPALHYALPALGVLAGLMLPDYVVGKLRKRYLDAVARGLPDALDMMVICSEAGLGLEPAIARVGEELRDAHPEMAKELRITAHEMQLMSDRRQVLVGMGERTQLDSLRRLGSTLIQTLQFGTPLTQALRTLASEMRQESMTLYEGRAAKLPVMLTFPMILFILPCVFIVVGGPAVLKVISVLGKH